jgi:hypothetical protein
MTRKFKKRFGKDYQEKNETLSVRPEESQAETQLTEQEELERAQDCLRRVIEREKQEERCLEMVRTLAELVGIADGEDITQDQIRNLEYASKKQRTGT